MSVSELPLPVGSLASQSTTAFAACSRVSFAAALPVTGVGIADVLAPEPLDFRWLTSTVIRRWVALTSKVCVSDGRLFVSMKRGSTADVRILCAPSAATSSSIALLGGASFSSSMSPTTSTSMAASALTSLAIWRCSSFRVLGMYRRPPAAIRTSPKRPRVKVSVAVSGCVKWTSIPS